MTYGVTIAGTNTKTQWDLILCADVLVGTPPLKSNLVEIPGRDGTVNMSYVVSDGAPVFGDREISFVLFCACDDDNLNQKRAALAALCHGKVATLVLPMDTTHYYRGVFSVGDISGFNSGRIPVSVIAEPYAFKNSATTVSKTIPAGGTLSVTLANETMPAAATITTNAAITLTYDGSTYNIASGTRALPIKIPSGGATVSIAGTQGTSISVNYQEGRI